MADKIARTYKVDFSFVDGEAPTAAKFTTWNRQIANALATIEKALGDPWDESYPYFSTSDTLAVAGALSTSGVTIGDDRKLEIANIARLIGPSSSLNPMQYIDLDDAEKTVTETIPSSGNNFTLKYPPNIVETITFTGTGTVFTTKVTNTNLNAAGEYSLNILTGEIYTYDDMNGGTITYYVDVGDVLGSGHLDGYTNAGFNTIPDQNQTTKCVCSGPDVNGKYTITLPVLTDTISTDTGLISTLEVGDLGYGSQMKMPFVLRHLAAGDTIPDGFLFIRDDTTKQLYRSAIYYYENSSSLKVSGYTLDTSHGFTIITVGTTITQSIAQLKRNLWKLKRGRDTTSIMAVDYITNKCGITTDELYVPSEASFNQFPQYFHRDGWFANKDDTNINDQNGIRGDMVLLSTTRSSGSKNNLTANSVALYFGKHTDGPSIYHSFDYEAGIGYPNYSVLKFDKNTSSLFVFDGEVYSESEFKSLLGASLGVGKGSAYEAYQGPFMWVYDELVFRENGGAINIDLSASVQLILSGKTVISCQVLAQPPALGSTAWYPSGTSTATNYEYTWNLDADVSATRIVLNDVSIGFSNASDNNLKVFIMYKA